MACHHRARFVCMTVPDGTPVFNLVEQKTDEEDEPDEEGFWDQLFQEDAAQGNQEDQ